MWVGCLVCINLMAVVDSRCNLSEDAAGFCFWQSPPLLYVIIQLSSAGVLHHNHNLIPALKHCQHRKTESFLKCFGCVGFQLLCNLRMQMLIVFNKSQ